ncbi:MAG: PilZ domain-containing protein [Rhizobiales bacterium]|nr:PilZ domain-containing protein [Hyphomicrobiales bacterium]
MATQGQLSESRPRGTLSRIAADRRRHKRCTMSLIGRFMSSDQQEHPCRLRDISVGGAAIETNRVVGDGERIVAYFDELGRLEGTVTRRFDGGFGMQFVNTQHKREKLAATLTWLVNRHLLDPADERRHERIVPNVREAVITLANGAMLQCRLNDVSVGGASISAEVKPEVGENILLGKLRGRVVRHHEQGFSVQFTDIQSPNAIRRNFS